MDETVYGSCDKFLFYDNGGEFVNKGLLALAESCGIYIHTTPAESPWSNGVVERHNEVLADMLDRIIADTGCATST